MSSDHLDPDDFTEALKSENENEINNEGNNNEGDEQGDGERSEPGSSEPGSSDEEIDLENKEGDESENKDDLEKKRKSEDIAKLLAQYKENQVFPILFEISVTSPEKKGEGMNAYMAYTVNTKTSSSDYENPQMSVTRRFSNFEYLYLKLTTKYPGIIVPPIPEKQALGRFEANFIDHRRAFLEKFLKRIADHPILSKSTDFKIFLQSQDYDSEIKKKEQKKGIISTITGVVTSTSSQGFSKIRSESNPWFETQASQLEYFEIQLKSLHKSVEQFVKLKRDITNACQELGEAFSTLGEPESNVELASCFASFREVEKKIYEIQMKQATVDENYLCYTFEEYLKLIDSVKVAVNSRVKAYSTWKSVDMTLMKKKEQLFKMKQGSKTPKVEALEAEVDELEKRVEKLQEEFEQISELLKYELTRFEKQKKEDFHAGFQNFVETMHSTQHQIVNLWKDYLLKLSNKRSST